MARTSMSLLDAAAWVASTGKRLEGRRASNFYFDREQGIVIVKLQGVDGLLVLEGGRRIHLSRRVGTPGEFKPYPLVVLLRKRLRGRRLAGTGLIGGDRIVELRWPGGERLVAELVPRGLVVLVSPEGRVLASDKTLRARDRVIKPGASYEPPPARPSLLAGLLGLGEPPGYPECLRSGRDLVRGLVRGCGVPGEAAEEAIYRAGLDPRLSPAEAREEDLEMVLEELRGIVGESMRGAGYLVVRDGRPVEASPFRPLRFRDAEVREYSELDEALDALFSGPPPARGTPGAAGGAGESAELARLQASLERAEAAAREYRAEAERLREAAARLSQAYHVLARLLEEASRGAEARAGQVRAAPAGREIVVEAWGARIRVPRGSPPERVIVELYKRAGELEAKAERALRAREEAEKRLEVLRLKAAAREIAARARRRRRYWYERYHWTVTRGGFLAVGGRDAQQNEAVVKKYLGPGDIFLHASIHGAPAVVLKTGGATPGEGDLWDAAVLTAAYSKAWKSGLGSVEVYWVPSGQVSFSPPSGEYLAKGGIMVYGRKNYLPRPVPVRVAVGIALNEEGVPVVIAGSREAVEPRSIAYAILAPGDMGKEEAAKRLKEDLASAAGRERAPLVYAVDEQEISPRIPGRARIVRAARGGGAGVEMGRYG